MHDQNRSPRHRRCPVGSSDTDSIVVQSGHHRRKIQIQSGAAGSKTYSLARVGLCCQHMRRLAWSIVLDAEFERVVLNHHAQLHLAARITHTVTERLHHGIECQFPAEVPEQSGRAVIVDAHTAQTGQRRHPGNGFGGKSATSCSRVPGGLEESKRMSLIAEN